MLIIGIIVELALAAFVVWGAMNEAILLDVERAAKNELKKVVRK